MVDPAALTARTSHSGTARADYKNQDNLVSVPKACRLWKSTGKGPPGAAGSRSPKGSDPEMGIGDHRHYDTFREEPIDGATAVSARTG
jgi:hypothetical protein